MEIPSSPRSSVQSNYDDAYYSEKDFAKEFDERCIDKINKLFLFKLFELLIYVAF